MFATRRANGDHRKLGLVGGLDEDMETFSQFPIARWGSTNEPRGHRSIRRLKMTFDNFTAPGTRCFVVVLYRVCEIAPHHHRGNHFTDNFAPRVLT